MKIMEVEVQVCNQGNRKREMRDFEIEKSWMVGVVEQKTFEDEPMQWLVYETKKK